MDCAVPSNSESTHSEGKKMGRRFRMARNSDVLICDKLGVVGLLRRYSKRLGFLIGAEGGTRTPTSYLTRPSNVRVCQFRHFGSFGKDYQTATRKRFLRFLPVRLRRRSDDS